MTEYYLAFFQNKNRFNPFARIIEFVERRQTSHVEIVKCVDGDFELSDTWGSIFPKSRKMKLADFKLHYKVERFVPLHTKLTEAECDVILDSLCHKPYSFAQIILIGLKILGRGSLVWIDGVKPNLSKYLICTELAGIFLQEACQYKFAQSPECLSLRDIEFIALKNLPIDEVAK